MNQRVVAATVAVPLVCALMLVAAFRPLPYSTYGPGPTIDVLSDSNGKEIIQIQGQKTYRDDGELRMTTVSVSPADANLNLFEVMTNWFDRSDAVYPHAAVYPDNQSAADAKQEGAIEMASSQDTAVAVALRALGYPVTPELQVQSLLPGSPADGALALQDLIIAINGTTIDGSDLQKADDELTAAITHTTPGQSVNVTVLRDGKQVTVPVTPTVLHTADLFGLIKVQGPPQVGIGIGEGFILPFQVQVDIDPAIGGPSAGLMFSLGIYDTLTPGSLTKGGDVAGTGEIAADGTVGPIGGIQQKIVGARESGAQLFLVPADNCQDAHGAHNGSMRLAKVSSFKTALSVVQTWAANHDAALPSCGGS